MIKIQIRRYGRMAMILMAVILLAGCSSSDSQEVPTDITKLGEPISLTISIPTGNGTNNARTRVGDPGESTQEGIDWDKLAIIVAYKSKVKSDDSYDSDPQKMVYWDVFSRDDFEKDEKVSHAMSTLDAPEGENGTRSVTMYLPVGTVNVYGVTYSDGAGFDLEGELNKIAKDGDPHNSVIEGLQISNDYAKGDGKEIAKFLSVATGYGINTKIAHASRDLVISKSNSEIEMKQYWAMTLKRLACQLDIQWDAAQGYNNGNLVDCTISQFQYNGGASTSGTGGTNAGTSGITGSGYGRLFPTLQAPNVAAVGGSRLFINQTPISQRNGRVYHYVFPDGSKSPDITFLLNLTTQDPNTGAESKLENKTYTFKLDNIAPLQPATWYKINTKIKGMTTSSEAYVGTSAN